MLLYGIAVVLIILFKPSGLYGYKEFSIRRFCAFFKNLFKGGKKAEAVTEKEEAGKK